MSNTILVLADATEITMEDNSNMHNVIVKSSTKAVMAEAWEKFTDANLKAVQLKIDGVVSGNYEDLVLVDEKSVVQADGSVLIPKALQGYMGTDRITKKDK